MNGGDSRKHQCVDQIWCGTAELLERPLQLTQILVQIALRGRQRLIGDIADPPHRVDGVGEQVALLAKCSTNGGNSVSTWSSVSVRSAHIGQQPVGGIDGVGDVVALLVELAGEGVQLAEKLSDLVGTPARML